MLTTGHPLQEARHPHTAAAPGWRADAPVQQTGQEEIAAASFRTASAVCSPPTDNAKELQRSETLDSGQQQSRVTPEVKPDALGCFWPAIYAFGYVHTCYFLSEHEAKGNKPTVF